MKIIFIGEKDFADIFNSFGMETMNVNSSEEAQTALKACTKQYGLSCAKSRFEGLICLQRKFSDALGAAGHLDGLNVILLSEKLDERSIIDDFRRISEKAAGVDLTNKRQV